MIFIIGRSPLVQSVYCLAVVACFDFYSYRPRVNQVLVSGPEIMQEWVLMAFIYYLFLFSAIEMSVQWPVERELTILLLRTASHYVPFIALACQLCLEISFFVTRHNSKFEIPPTKLGERDKSTGDQRALNPLRFYFSQIYIFKEKFNQNKKKEGSTEECCVTQSGKKEK